MIADKNNEPVCKVMSLDHWERSLDPWHPEAFPAEFRMDIAVMNGNDNPRAEGWMAVDWCGNPLMFIADGTEIK